MTFQNKIMILNKTMKMSSAILQSLLNFDYPKILICNINICQEIPRKILL
jgi:hypothetical protein